MTDRIAEALDEFVPSFETIEGDWKGVLHEAAVASRAEHRPRLRQRRRRLLVAAALLATVAVGTAAIAVGLGAFNGIGAAQHPIGTADVLDPATAAYVQGHLAGIRLDTTRHIGQLPDGQNVYVITGTQNDLCTVVGPPNGFAQCGDPLSDAHPATITGYYTANNDPSVRWIVFGLALDDVTSVTFQPQSTSDGAPAGPQVTVPVTNNLWTYESNQAEPPYVLQPVTAHFANGTTVTEPATGKNCAAC